MKILFLHLSDLHIKQNEHIEIHKIDKLVDALNIVQGFDECIIICSGDLASSGGANDYKQVRFLFGRLFSKIREKLSYKKYLNFLLVPGNHDASFVNVKRTCDDIQQYYEKSEVAQHVNEEIDMLRNFIIYSEQQNGCFRYEKICDKKFVKYGEYMIQINLINTALFSTLKLDDKELHYFPNEKLSLLRKHDKANLAITIMHHSIEWFHWECKQNLEKAIYNNSSILFLGHDHSLSTRDLNVDNSNSIFISAGGEFSNKDIVGKSEFNAIILNTNSNLFDSYAFEWNGNMYMHKKLFKDKSLIINSEELLPNKKFIDSIKEDEKRRISEDFTQYFVFPTLTERKYKDKEKIEISNLDDFINEIKKRKYINIIGGENSGKTALMKISFLYFLKNMTPLFFDLENINGKKINKIVRLAFEDQYSEDPLHYQKYQQLNKSKKVAIIDDFDMIKREKTKSEIIELFKNEFEYIIIGTRNSEEYNLEASVKNEIENRDFSIFVISNFYYKKRYELIKNISKILKPVNDGDIEKIVYTINGFVKHHFQLFDLDPDFIIQFTQFFLINAVDFQNLKNESIFNKIFETNIYNSIILNSEKEMVDETITYLEEIAYYIHFNKKDPLPLTDLQIIIDNYNEKYNEDYSSINIKKLVDVACKAKILKYTNDLALKFCNKNHLAFFVARCLNRKFNIDESFSDIEYVLKNICFGINDNIILFMSYLMSNPRIIMSIYENAESLMNDWEEFDIDKKNIAFLSKINESQKIKAPTNEDKEKIEEIETQLEEYKKKDQQIECKTIYDYDENEIDIFKYKISRALKYTEMISKSLPNLHNILVRENKQKLMDGIYKYPNRILFKLLKPIDKDFEKIVKTIKEFSDFIGARNKKGEVITEVYIETMIHRHALAKILGMYDNFAYLATDKKSISILNQYILDNTNYNIFNLMIAENFGETESFTKKAENIYDKAKDNNIKTMVSLIVRKHLIYGTNIKYNKRQPLVDKFFKTDRKKFLTTPKEKIE
ncbi:MAG: metallophosphoesterase family protein [Desulfitobacteriaceae bacterium]